MPDIFGNETEEERMLREQGMGGLTTPEDILAQPAPTLPPEAPSPMLEQPLPPEPAPSTNPLLALARQGRQALQSGVSGATDAIAGTAMDQKQQDFNAMATPALREAMGKLPMVQQQRQQQAELQQEAQKTEDIRQAVGAEGGVDTTQPMSPSISGALSRYAIRGIELANKGANLTADATAEAANKAADVYNAEYADREQRIARTQQEQLKARDGLMKRMEDLQAEGIDTGRYWSNMNALGKVGALIGVFLGGYYQDKSGGKNLILEMINNNIDRDVQAQQSDQNKNLQLLREQYNIQTDYLDRTEKAMAEHAANKLNKLAAIEQVAKAKAAEASKFTNDGAAMTKLGEISKWVGERKEQLLMSLAKTLDKGIQRKHSGKGGIKLGNGEVSYENGKVYAKNVFQSEKYLNDYYGVDDIQIVAVPFMDEKGNDNFYMPARNFTNQEKFTNVMRQASESAKARRNLSNFLANHPGMKTTDLYTDPRTKNEMQRLMNEYLLSVKEEYNLGVLSGPDVGIVEKVGNFDSVQNLGAQVVSELFGDALSSDDMLKSIRFQEEGHYNAVNQYLRAFHPDQGVRLVSPRAGVGVPAQESAADKETSSLAAQGLVKETSFEGDKYLDKGDWKVLSPTEKEARREAFANATNTARTEIRSILGDDSVENKAVAALTVWDGYAKEYGNQAAVDHIGGRGQLKNLAKREDTPFSASLDELERLWGNKFGGIEPIPEGTTGWDKIDYDNLVRGRGDEAFRSLGAVKEGPLYRNADPRGKPVTSYKKIQSAKAPEEPTGVGDFIGGLVSTATKKGKKAQEANEKAKKKLKAKKKGKK